MKEFRLIKIKRKDCTVADEKERVVKTFVVRVNSAIPKSHKMCK